MSGFSSLSRSTSTFTLNVMMLNGIKDDGSVLTDLQLSIWSFTQPALKQICIHNSWKFISLTKFAYIYWVSLLVAVVFFFKGFVDERPCPKKGWRWETFLTEPCSRSYGLNLANILRWECAEPRLWACEEAFCICFPDFFCLGNILWKA